jgi:hypothetical protein
MKDDLGLTADEWVILRLLSDITRGENVNVRRAVDYLIKKHKAPNICIAIDRLHEERKNTK